MAFRTTTAPTTRLAASVAIFLVYCYMCCLTRRLESITVLGCRVAWWSESVEHRLCARRHSSPPRGANLPPKRTNVLFAFPPGRQCSTPRWVVGRDADQWMLEALRHCNGRTLATRHCPSASVRASGLVPPPSGGGASLGGLCRSASRCGRTAQPRPPLPAGVPPVVVVVCTLSIVGQARPCGPAGPSTSTTACASAFGRRWSIRPKKATEESTAEGMPAGDERSASRVESLRDGVSGLRFVRKLVLSAFRVETDLATALPNLFGARSPHLLAIWKSSQLRTSRKNRLETREACSSDLSGPLCFPLGHGGFWLSIGGRTGAGCVQADSGTGAEGGDACGRRRG